MSKAIYNLLLAKVIIVAFLLAEISKNYWLTWNYAYGWQNAQRTRCSKIGFLKAKNFSFELSIIRW